MNMNPKQMSVFILMILFHLTNVISGASLGNVNLFNDTFDDADEQHRTVLQRIQNNYADEFRNYEMADIENFLAGFMSPVKKERKPIYTSKTYFGSDQFFGDRERSKENPHHKTWDPFRANHVIGSQPSYFDVPDDVFQQYVYSSYSKTGDDNASDFPHEIADLPENKDKIPSLEINSFTDEENEFSRSKDDEVSEDQLHEDFHAVDGKKDQMYYLSLPEGDEVEDRKDKLSHLVDDAVDENSHLVDDDAGDEVDENSHLVDDDAGDELDVLSHTVDDDAEYENELSLPLDDAEDRKDEVSHQVDGDKDQVDERSQPVDGSFQRNFSTDTEDGVDKLSNPVDDYAKDEMVKTSRPVLEPQGGGNKLTHSVDETQGQVEEISHSVDGTQVQVDKLSTFEKDVLDSKDSHRNKVITEKVFSQLSHSTMAGVNEELVGFNDSTENKEDVFSQSVDGDVSQSGKDELISEGEDVDSEFFRLDKLNASKVIEDLRHLKTTNTKNPFDNPKNEADILALDEQNGNGSHFGELAGEHLRKGLSGGDSDFVEFKEKSFDKTLDPTKDLDLHKMDMDEFQGSGDMSDSFDDALTDTLLDSKSGRIVDGFLRVNNTAECTTPKGERGHCRSLTQCPLSEPLNNFNLFLKYVCLSRGILVGICCPDNPVVEILDPTENSTGTPVTEFKQPTDGCGLNINTRIVGGMVSLPHEWTWMVALLRRNRFFCGGVIINDWYILTAAHCVMGVKVKDLKVRLGEYNFSEKNEHQEDIPVAEIKRHALFVTLTFQHDIALLKLKRRIEYTKFIGSICLPNPKSGNFSNVNATVVGWGTVAFGGTASPVLRQVTVPVWDNDECDKTYRLERITNAFMCAGSPEKGEDACQGDSGGPLMALNEAGRWEVIGIVSWGRRCGDPTFPGVYTRVTSYSDWITENAN